MFSFELLSRSRDLRDKEGRERANFARETRLASEHMDRAAEHLRRADEIANELRHLGLAALDARRDLLRSFPIADLSEGDGEFVALVLGFMRKNFTVHDQCDDYQRVAPALQVLLDACEGFDVGYDRCHLNDMQGLTDDSDVRAVHFVLYTRFDNRARAEGRQAARLPAVEVLDALWREARALHADSSRRAAAANGVLFRELFWRYVRNLCRVAPTGPDQFVPQGVNLRHRIVEAAIFAMSGGRARFSGVRPMVRLALPHNFAGADLYEALRRDGPVENLLLPSQLEELRCAAVLAYEGNPFAQLAADAESLREAEDAVYGRPRQMRRVD
jgi:hypothetical protein